MIGNRVMESNVRSYSRAFGSTFDQASGAEMFDETGVRHLDFLAGCGSLNYGHNHPVLKAALMDYVARDGLCMSLDLNSTARSVFLERFERIVLAPRGLDYLVQFPGPTGANCVEAAIKLARKATGRSNVISFTNGFHGCSLGALSLTGSSHHRAGSAALLQQVSRMPYEGYLGTGFDTADYIGRMLDDPSSGIDAPAAFVVELVQGEGGLQSASAAWVRRLQEIARKHGALLIVDDIQAGCGRTGTFFSFEPLGIVPDMVCLAKAVSGYGLPMSLLLLKPELDCWEPGEHNGTFRGNSHAFVTAAAALEHFWGDPEFVLALAERCTEMQRHCAQLVESFGLRVKGRGMMMGLEFSDDSQAAAVQADCVRRGLIIERCGPHDEVLKFLPPLTLTPEQLDEGFAIVRQALSAVVGVRECPSQPRVPDLEPA